MDLSKRKKERGNNNMKEYGYIAIIKSSNKPEIWIDDCGSWYDNISEIKQELNAYMIESDTDYLSGVILAVNKCNFTDIKSYNFTMQTHLRTIFNIEEN